MAVMSRLVDLPRVTVRGTQFDFIISASVIVSLSSKVSTHPVRWKWLLSYRAAVCEKVDENMSEEITLTLDNYDL